MIWSYLLCKCVRAYHKLCAQDAENAHSDQQEDERDVILRGYVCVGGRFDGRRSHGTLVWMDCWWSAYLRGDGDQSDCNDPELPLGLLFTYDVKWRRGYEDSDKGRDPLMKPLFIGTFNRQPKYMNNKKHSMLSNECINYNRTTLTYCI